MNPLRAFWLRPRLLGAVLGTLALAAILPFASLAVRLLVGWCLGVTAYVALIFGQAWAEPRNGLKADASRLDDSALVITLFAILSTAASFGAVALLVFGEKGGHASALLLLAAATMVCAWVFVQVVFTAHYAHLYYGEGEAGGSRGGLDFNGDAEPDFWDFLYFSMTIGATSQTSDTAITSKTMRRIATVQTVYAYFFNTSLLALAINMAAGIAQQH